MAGRPVLKLAVVGLGHVGLPTAIGLAETGWDVIGAEDDLAKAESIARGHSPFYEPGLEELLRRHLDRGNFSIANDVATAVRDSSVLFVCVGTPQGEDGSPDLSQLDRVSRTIGENLNGYKLIVEKSTTPVQTAEQLRHNISRYGGANEREIDFDVAVNPEFLREGSALEDFLHPDRIVLGVESDRAAQLLLKVYAPLLERIGARAESAVILTDVNTAEIIKHASNGFLATKISFANMLSDICEATGANVEHVTKGMGMDPRIGPSFLEAGLGFGGYCLPKDLRAFAWMADKNGVEMSLLREVERINENRIDRVLSKVREAMCVMTQKKVAVWGLAFKPGTDDVREAPSVKMVERLLNEGAFVRLYDPRAMGEFKRYFIEDPPRVSYCSGPEDTAEGADALLILTEWPEFCDVDLLEVQERMAVPLIVDGRNMLDPLKTRSMGFEYHSMGRP